ncbi:MAG: hypothetical protein MJY98_09565 [Fibrobacter sp.]|nr:hypothetical protein [Fibrobacter sp.]
METRANNVLENTRSADWERELVTHYTGIGTEVREYKPWNFVRFTDSQGVEHCISANPDYAGTASTTCPLPDTVRVVVPLPNGLGRHALQNAAYEEPLLQGAYEFYLKDHLGSARVVYGVGYPDPLGISPNGVFRAAYDYRSFGEQLNLFVFSRKVTENFTGKELDDETELNYFGARYLDPMLGLWTSVDPARQFFASYAYAGNRTNPTNGIDANGDYLVRKRGGSYEIKTVSKAEAVSGWFIKDFTPLFMKGPGFAFTIVKDYIDEKNSSKGQNGRYLGKDLIIQGAEKLTSYENKAVGKGVGAALGVFDAYRSFKMLEYDSPEFIENFNSRMISNGGDSYNSFSSPEDAHDFANKVQQSLEPNGNVTYGDLIIENE